MSKYNQNIEDWWRHNGMYDRQQASGIPYDGDDENYLQKTDDWWDSLTAEDKEDVFNDFFSEE